MATTIKQSGNAAMAQLTNKEGRESITISEETREFFKITDTLEDLVDMLDSASMNAFFGESDNEVKYYTALQSNKEFTDAREALCNAKESVTELVLSLIKENVLGSQHVVLI
ncbi:MAG: hypothetical protein WC871_02615 [Bacteroidales bacterium]|jgi:glucan phosphoethanolaminetransferase (alkaline phosphatase superfamily)